MRRSSELDNTIEQACMFLIRKSTHAPAVIYGLPYEPMRMIRTEAVAEEYVPVTDKITRQRTKLFELVIL